MFADTTDALLRRGDWIAIATIALLAIVALWRALTRQNDGVKTLKDVVDSNTRSNESVSREIGNLSKAIDRSASQSEQANEKLANILEEEFKRRRR